MMFYFRKLHLCLTVAVAANTLGVIAEAALPKTDIKPAIARGCLTIWQGTWFLHIGVVNWPLPWPLGDLLVWRGIDSHANVMFTDTVFVGHLLSIMAFALLAGKVTRARVAKTARGAKAYGMNGTNNNYKLMASSENDGFLAEETA